ncbi:hypothetical protein ACH419_32805 [Streptomyces bobili]|uniref:hypothetical protein n=1 Tax=Streptomyces bobili TaxID=67280 RepID=UPI0037B0603C
MNPVEKEAGTPPQEQHAPIRREASGFASVMARLNGSDVAERAALAAETEGAMVGYEAYSIGQEHLARGAHTAAGRWLKIAARHGVPGAEQAVAELAAHRISPGFTQFTARDGQAVVVDVQSFPAARAEVDLCQVGGEGWELVLDVQARQEAQAARAEAEQITLQARRQAAEELRQAQERAAQAVSRAKELEETMRRQAEETVRHLAEAERIGELAHRALAMAELYAGSMQALARLVETQVPLGGALSVRERLREAGDRTAEEPQQVRNRMPFASPHRAQALRSPSSCGATGETSDGPPRPDDAQVAGMTDALVVYHTASSPTGARQDPRLREPGPGALPTALRRTHVVEPSALRDVRLWPGRIVAARVSEDGSGEDGESASTEEWVSVWQVKCAPVTTTPVITPWFPVDDASAAFRAGADSLQLVATSLLLHLSEDGQERNLGEPDAEMLENRRDPEEAGTSAG